MAKEQHIAEPVLGAMVKQNSQEFKLIPIIFSSNYTLINFFIFCLPLNSEEYFIYKTPLASPTHLSPKSHILGVMLNKNRK